LLVALAAADGQNWGFPTYNWEEMAKDNYAWWRQRLAVMEKYFHAYRIDHVLGFFRIWEIPQSQVRGLIGRFHPVLPCGGGNWRTGACGTCTGSPVGPRFLPSLHYYLLIYYLSINSTIIHSNW
jgi:hypothetical protein